MPTPLTRQSAITVVRITSLTSFVADPFRTPPASSVYRVRTGAQDWHADSAEHAREQHEDAFAGDAGETIDEITLALARLGTR
jgi:hypothetical protein